MFIVCKVIECEDVKNKDRLKKLKVDIGKGDDDCITVVSNAPNVRLGTRTVVALVGTVLPNDEVVQKVVVAGITSQGMLCDSPTLSWVGGAANQCVLMPDSYELGSIAPASKPRGDGAVKDDEPVVEVSAKELKAKEKADRKAQLALKKTERKSKKDSSAACTDIADEVGSPNIKTGIDVDDGDADDA